MKAEKQRALVAEELLETERSYARSLHVVVDVFMKPLRTASQAARAGVSAASVDLVFAHWLPLTALHDELLAQLERRIGGDAWHSAACVGDVISGIVPYLRMYTAYVDAFDDSAAAVAKWNRSHRATQVLQVL